MGHVVADKPWGVIDIVKDEGRIFFQQKWRYNWQLSPGVTDVWTYNEKKAFHTQVDKTIWRVWSNKIKFRVSGTNDFAKKHMGKGIPINFDIKWVVKETPHWKVAVLKLPAGSTPTTHISFVDFTKLEIELDTADFASYCPTNDAGVTVCGFEAIPHEFVHTLDNPDEYTSGSPHLPDTNSLANIGSEIRARHLALITTELNKMMPGVTFTPDLPPDIFHVLPAYIRSIMSAFGF